jgi:hypothetical protein
LLTLAELTPHIQEAEMQEQAKIHFRGLVGKAEISGDAPAVSAVEEIFRRVGVKFNNQVWEESFPGVQKFTEAEAAALKELGFEIEDDSARMTVGNNHMYVQVLRWYGKVTGHVYIRMPEGTLHLQIARDALIGAMRIIKHKPQE